MTVIRVKKTSDNGKYNGKWAVFARGGVSRTFDTKKEAKSGARSKAVVGDTVHIEKANGVVQTSHTKEEHSPHLGFFANW